jgi:hypothetical protein
MGAVEWFGIGFEATYGTGVEPTVFYRPGSNTLRATPVTEALLGPSGAFARFRYDASLPRHLRLPSDRSGQVVLELDYDDVGWLLTNLMVQPSGAVFAVNGGESTWTMPGSGPVPTNSPGSGNPYVASSPPTAMTCVRNHGLTNRDYKIGGCLINKAVFRGQAGSLVTATLDIVGATGGEPYTPIGTNYENGSTPTFSAAPFIEHFHSDIGVSTNLAAPVTNDFYANTGGDVSEWTLTYDNQYDISPSAGGGTLGIRFPTWQSAPQITLEYTHRWTTAKEFDLYHPTAEPSRYKYVRLRMQHPTSQAGNGSGSPATKTLWFDMPAGFFLGDPPTYDGGTGFIEQHVRVEAAGGGTALSGAIIQAKLFNDTDDPWYSIEAP